MPSSRHHPCVLAASSSPKTSLANVSPFPAGSFEATFIQTHRADPNLLLLTACPEGCQKCSSSSDCDACAPIDGFFAVFDAESTQCALGCTGEGCRKQNPEYTFNLLEDSDRCQRGYTYSAEYRTCLQLSHQECHEDVLSVLKQPGDGTSHLAPKEGEPSIFTYYLGASEWTYTPAVSHSSEATCGMTCRLDESGAQPDWDVITTFDPASGSFSVMTSDA